ncbi:MAG: peptidoglycan-binding protein [Candidatus Gracilibacteria bacterium]
MKTKIIKNIVVTGFSAFYIGVQIGMPLLSNFANAEGIPEAPAEESASYYVQTFITTAYYSPLLGQNHYVTGSYDGDIYLNGNGTNGADGTEVYPGMVAAPKTYAFGTKMYIPGIGMVAVHDRGGAIKSAGERGNAYDRLDIWMGSGDSGLAKALSWGKRTVDIRVYGVQPSLAEGVYFDDYLGVQDVLNTTILSPLEFPSDIYFGSSGEDVTRMQGYLKDWGYLQSEANGFYGSDTAQAIFEFQMDFNIVTGPDELGAGHFGINTRKKFDALIKNEDTATDTIQAQKGEVLMAKYPDLYEKKTLFGTALTLGDSGDTVRMLQEELVNLGYLRIAPTGYFGETTVHALYKYQQSIGLVDSKEDSGAGYLGPNTRSALNKILENRYSVKSMLAFEREEVSSGRHIVALPDEVLATLKKDEE